MKRYLIGFVVGVCTAGSVAFAVETWEILDFERAVKEIVGLCIVTIHIPINGTVEISSNQFIDPSVSGDATGNAYITC